MDRGCLCEQACISTGLFAGSQGAYGKEEVTAQSCRSETAVYELGTTVFDRTTNKWVFNCPFAFFVVEEGPRFDGVAFMNPMLLDLKV